MLLAKPCLQAVETAQHAAQHSVQQAAQLEEFVFASACAGMRPSSAVIIPMFELLSAANSVKLRLVMALS